MLPDQILQLFFWSYIAGSLGAVGTKVIGSSVYAWRYVKAEQDRLRHLHSRQYKQRPTITVIVWTRDHEKVVRRCLRSIVRGSYRKYRIVVIDMGSQDKTRQRVREFIKTYPKQDIRLLAKSQNGDAGALLKKAFKPSKDNSLVVAVAGSSELAPYTLHAVQQQFAYDGYRQEVVMLHERPRLNLEVKGIFRELDSVMTAQASKSQAWIRWFAGDNPGVHTAYVQRHFESVVKDSFGGTARNVTNFADKAVVYVPYAEAKPAWFGRQKPNARRRIARNATAGASAVVASYALYLAFFAQTAQPLAIVWSVTTLGAVSALLDSRHFTFGAKLWYASFAPALFLVKYATNIWLLLREVALLSKRVVARLGFGRLFGRAEQPAG